LFDFGKEISGHFYRGDISEGDKGEPNDVLVRVVQITVALLVHSHHEFEIEPNFFKEFVTKVRTS